MKRKEYSVGGYIPTPEEALATHQQNLALSQMEASQNPMIQGLYTLSGLLGSGGNILLQQGLSSYTPKMAYGGEVPVEVEGGEMGELPNGMVLDFEGDSHEEGGIPIDLPMGTKVYSDRVAIDGQTMAQRKAKRERKINALQKKVEGGDRVAKSTLERYLMTAEQEEAMDMQVQEALNSARETHSGREKLGGGTSGVTPKPMKIPLLNPKPINPFGGSATSYATKNYRKPKIKKGNYLDFLMDSTPYVLDALDNIPYVADTVGMIGNLQAGNANQRAVAEAKANMKPNTNHYKHYGERGLDTLNESKKYSRAMGEIARGDIEGQRITALRGNRGTARGVNTMRAMDLATQSQANRMNLQAYQQEMAQLQNLLNMEAQMQNQQDQVRMGGEEGRDLRDRDELANLNNMQLRADLASANALTHTAKSFNDALERKATMKAMNQIYGNFDMGMLGDLKKVLDASIKQTHISDVRANPERFGLSKEQVKKMSDVDIIKNV